MCSSVSVCPDGLRGPSRHCSGLDLIDIANYKLSLLCLAVKTDTHCAATGTRVERGDILIYLSSLTRVLVESNW